MRLVSGVLRWGAAVVLALLSALVLTLLTIEPLALSDSDLARIRFLTIAPAAVPASSPPAQPRLPPCKALPKLSNKHKPEQNAEVKNSATDEPSADEDADDGRVTVGGGWLEAEAREWRGVVDQVSRAFASGTTDFWFRFPARPSAPAARRINTHSGLPRVSEVRRCGNTIVLYLSGAWSGLFSTRPKTYKWHRWMGNTIGLKWAMRCAWRARLPCPIVGFNMPSSRGATFDAGQAQDCKALEYVYDVLERRFAGAKIVIVAACLGGLRVVNWLAQRKAQGLSAPPSLAALALESPLPSLADYAPAVVNGERSQKFVYGLMIATLPCYRAALDPLYTSVSPSESSDEDVRLVPKGVPVLVSVLASDPCSNLETLQPLLARLPDAHVLVSHRRRVTGGASGRSHIIDHGRLILAPEHQVALRILVADVIATNSHDNVRNSHDNVRNSHPSSASKRRPVRKQSVEC